MCLPLKKILRHFYIEQRFGKFPLGKIAMVLLSTNVP